jgi:hypothetical protein
LPSTEKGCVLGVDSCEYVDVAAMIRRFYYNW